MRTTFKSEGNKPKVNPVKLAQRLVAVKMELDKAKLLYKEYDRLLQLALEQGGLPSRVSLQGTSWRIQIHDLFKDSNTSWKSVAQRRFDLIISK